MAHLGKSCQLNEKLNWNDGRIRSEYPIDTFLNKIFHLSANYQVVVVEADTGAGKTTRVPQWILLNSKAKIYMSSLRRNAVRNIGKRIALEMGCQPGGLVGWKLSSRGGKAECVISKSTRLTIMVDQSMVNWINRLGKLPEGYLIVDEAHDRNLAIDTVMGLIKIHLPNSPNTRVLITSATIDTAKFSAFFNNAPVVSVPGRCFPVEESVYQLSKEEHHSEGAGNAAVDVLKKFISRQLLVENKVVKKGAVIVLLPGKEDINAVSEKITKEIKNLGCEESAEVMKLFGGSSQEEDEAVQTEVEQGIIRFVCSTEVLRSQRTIPGVIGVIDSLQIKRKIKTARGAGRLKKIAVSKTEAIQGKGRAGRTCSGFYIAVSFGNEYENLEPYPMPAILREPIDSVILELSYSKISVRRFPFIDEPSQVQIEVGISRLINIGALNEKEEITELGRLLAQFSLDPGSAKALVVAEKYKILPEAIILAAIWENEGITFCPKKTGSIKADEWLVRHVLNLFQDSNDNPESLVEPVDINKVDLENLPIWISKKGDQFEIDGELLPHKDGLRIIFYSVLQSFTNGGRNDFAGFVRMYRAYKAKESEIKEIAWKKNAGVTDEKKKFNWRFHLRQWCQMRFLSHKKLEFVDGTICEIKNDLINSPLNLQNGIVEERDFNEDNLTKAMMAGMIDYVAVQIAERSYHCPVEDFSLAHHSVCGGGKVIFSGYPTKISTKGGRAFYLVNEAAHVNVAWVEEVLPNLCKRVRLNNYYYDKTSSSVLETECVLFSGRVIGEELVLANSTENAEKCFIAALARGEVEKTSLLINKNKELKKEHELLWIRSQGNYSRITEHDELSVYCRELLGKGIISFDLFEQAALNGRVSESSLSLPLVDKSKKKQILSANPDSVMVEGNEFPILYGIENERLYVRVEVTEEYIRKTSEVNIILPSGRQVELVCGNISGMTFQELLEAVEEKRISDCWKAMRSRYGIGITTDANTVVGWLKKIGSSVEVTREDNNQGKPIFGYIGLSYFAGYNGWKLYLYEDKNCIMSELNTALGNLLKVSAKEEITIPLIEPWYKISYFSRSLTDLGNKLQTALTEIVSDSMKNLSVDNFNIKAKTLKANASAVKSDLITEYVETKRRLEEWKKTALNVKSEIFGILHALKHGHNEFWKVPGHKRIVADEFIDRISKAYYNQQYKEVIEIAEEIRCYINEVSEIFVSKNSQAINPFEVDEVKFAKLIADVLGKDKAIKLLEKELRENYTFSKKQKNIREAVKERKDSCIENFIFLRKAKLVNSFISRAISFLKDVKEDNDVEIKVNLSTAESMQALLNKFKR